jgi:hypothetical protein
MSTSTITAFFAALVATPPDEAIPPINSELITDTSNFFKTIKKQIADLTFWQRFNDFHDQLVGEYTIQERNKILRPQVSSDASDQAAEEELNNQLLSAAEIMGNPSPEMTEQPSLEEIVNSPNPVETARRLFRQFGQDPLNWAIAMLQTRDRNRQPGQ